MGKTHSHRIPHVQSIPAREERRERNYHSCITIPSLSSASLRDYNAYSGLLLVEESNRRSRRKTKRTKRRAEVMKLWRRSAWPLQMAFLVALVMLCFDPVSAGNRNHRGPTGRWYHQGQTLLCGSGTVSDTEPQRSSCELSTVLIFLQSQQEDQHHGQLRHPGGAVLQTDACSQSNLSVAAHLLGLAARCRALSQTSAQMTSSTGGDWRFSSRSALFPPQSSGLSASSRLSASLTDAPSAQM
ncbi:hypothetical protein PAMA_010919 [Pampus argenteus]